jgi:HlyD family secretion protein
MTRKPILIGGALVLVAAGLLAVRAWRGSRRPDLVLYGNVDIREVEMAFRQSGRLSRVAFDEGARVKAGDLLAELDAQPYRDALAGAEAQVRLARAEVDKVHRGNRPQEIAQAEEGVRQAEAAFQSADRDLARQGGLVETGSASQRTLETARSARDQAAAVLASARKALELKREGWRREDVAQAEARLAAAEAARDQARTALDDARLTAPADAVVLSRVREPGSMVGAKDPVLTLSLRDPVYVRAYVGEKDLGRFSQGSRVELRTDSSGRAYHGSVGFVSPRAEFTPKSVETPDLRTDLVYRLRIVVADADPGLAQGMPVTIRVEAAGHGR